MRLSASNIGWSKKEDDAMYEFLKENGYRGVEVAPTRVTEVNPYDDIESVKVFAEKMKVRYGLSISSMQSIWYGKTENIFGSEEERKSLIDYTKRAIDYAAEAGCNNLVFGCPKNRNIREGMSKEECFEKALRFFREIGKYASEKNVVIAIEANPEIYGTNFINTTQEALELAEKIDCDGVKVNLDVGTMIYNDEKADILKGKVKLIHHVHISEPNLVAIKKRELHEQIVEILEKEKYAGYLSVEMSNKNGVDEVKAALKYVGGFGMGCRDGC
ncbi:sugar phosphate isomerase/epimerase [Candidatus Saccharibacteria bacterium]|nr:sugar phosphate isomerase/epimerase [Candidatus Saccharibacteria bacterium]